LLKSFFDETRGLRPWIVRFFDAGAWRWFPAGTGLDSAPEGHQEEKCNKAAEAARCRSARMM